jgi:hypothetical protein
MKLRLDIYYRSRWESCLRGMVIKKTVGNLQWRGSIYFDVYLYVMRWCILKWDRWRLTQEHLSAECNGFKGPRNVEGVLSTQCDGVSSLLTPSNKYCHHVTNIRLTHFLDSYVWQLCQLSSETCGQLLSLIVFVGDVRERKVNVFLSTEININSWYFLLRKHGIMKVAVCWIVSPCCLMCLPTFRGVCIDNRSSKHLWNVGQILRDYSPQYVGRLSCSFKNMFFSQSERRFHTHTKRQNRVQYNLWPFLFCC